MPELSRTSAIAFVDQLRAARLAALGNAEAYDEIVHVVERLGGYLSKERYGDLGKHGDLGKYSGALSELASRSGLAVSVPIQHRALCKPFDQLYALLRIGRNDAMHQGAFARHLTGVAIELSIILEDALSHYKEPIVADYIVRNPVCAELWQPISYIRQQMLANSYSYLPVFRDENWFVISDAALAVYLGAERDGTARTTRLAATLSAVFEQLNLRIAKPIADSTSLMEALAALNQTPVLLVHRGGDLKTLSGLLTAFDLL